VAIATHEGRIHNALAKLHARLLHQKIDTVVYEIQSLAAQEQEGTLKAGGAGAAGGRTLKRRERILQQTVTEISAALEELRRSRDQATTSLTETKVAPSRQKSRFCASFRQQQQSLEQRLQELMQLVRQRRSEVAGFFWNGGAQAEKEIQVFANAGRGVAAGNVSR